ncbi:hypothetical protein IFM89_020111, partial [Coptis chinensis]
KSATVSIDDFYLTAEDQAKMREQNPGNTILGGLTKMTKKGMKMKLPRYNKSAYHREGRQSRSFKMARGCIVRRQRLLREEGKPGMYDEEVRDFVSRYFPAYKAYLPALYSEGPLGSDPSIY